MIKLASLVKEGPEDFGAYRRIVITSDKAKQIESEIKKFMERPETKEKFPVKYSTKPGMKPETFVVDVEGKGATVIAIKATDIAKKLDNGAMITIRTERKLKEFTANPKETPVISYGNERRGTSTMPSLTKRDMNAIKTTNPLDEMHCVECMGQIGPDGYCSDCGSESHDNYTWGQQTDDHQATMAMAELRDMIKNASELYGTIQPGMRLPGWVAAYITLASDYMHSVNEYAQERTQE
jgi:hypothetical protein